MRKGILAGYRKLGPIGRLMFWCAIISIILAVLYFVVQQCQYHGDKSKAQYSGMLTKKNILLSAEKDILPKFELGDSGAIIEWNGPQGGPVFNKFKDIKLIVFTNDGVLKISTLIRDQNGAVIAKIEDNEWQVARPPKIFDRNYNNYALEVVNENNEVVLQIKLVKDRVQFQGVLYDSNGNGLFIGTGLRNGEKRGVIQVLSPSFPNTTFVIKPMFKYPSDRHLGELAN